LWRRSTGGDSDRRDHRRAIEGKILKPGHEVYDAYVGKPSPVPAQRNPIRYYSAPVGQKPCRCGCGGLVSSGDFVIGHDQKALYDRIKRVRDGTVVAFLAWFDMIRPPQGGVGTTDVRNPAP